MLHCEKRAQGTLTTKGNIFALVGNNINIVRSDGIRIANDIAKAHVDDSASVRQPWSDDDVWFGRASQYYYPRMWLFSQAALR